jgi:hypothetical protein
MRSDAKLGPSVGAWESPPAQPDHVAAIRRAAVIVGVQLYSEPLSTTRFDPGLYNVHIRRADGSYVCSTLPVTAFTDVDVLVGALLPWAHGR